MELKDSKDNVVAQVIAASPETGNVKSGVWLEFETKDGKKPTICIINDKVIGFYIGVYKDTKKVKLGCDLAVSFSEEGPLLQVTDGTRYKQVNLLNLLEKLENL